MAQTLWFVSFVSFFYGCIQLKPFWITLRESFGVGKKILQFQKASVSVFQLQELLSSGLVPEPNDWNRLMSLPEPWNQIASQSVVELRDLAAADPMGRAVGAGGRQCAGRIGRQSLYRPGPEGQIQCGTGAQDQDHY